jgi:hypothetical protein
MEIRVQWTLAQPQQPMNASAAAPNHPRGMDCLRDTFNRVKQAEELRLSGKLDAAQTVCQQLLHEHPHYWAALHTLGLVMVDKVLNYLVRAGNSASSSSVYSRRTAKLPPVVSRRSAAESQGDKPDTG